MKLTQQTLSKLMLAFIFAVITVATTHAVSAYLSSFRTTYPATTYPNVSTLNTCLLCHAGYPSASPNANNLNSYGNDYATYNYSYAAMEGLDSDGDGFTNIAEIRAGSFPGDASSRPATATTYTVGGALSGLSSGTVVLQNNGSGNLSLSANGAFTFATALASGSAYSVTVFTQPAGQTCSVANGSGTIGSANVTNVAVSCAALPPTTYTIGGSLSGLSSGTVVLQNNGSGNLSRSANGAFTFATALTSGSAYSVTVFTQPAGQTCSVANGTGTIGSVNVTNVAVSCAALPPSTYTVGGTVSGLSSGTVVLQNNGSGNLSLSANGAFTFASALISGSAYSVAVLTQPAGQTCSVANGSGTIGSANVSNVAVSCAALPPTTYTVGGALSGLSSGTVVLQNNGSGNLSLSANGAFTFASALISGSAYNVTVFTQPASQTCSVANGSGTIGSANVTNVVVSCAALPPSTYTVGGTLSGLSSGTLVLQNNGSGNLSLSANGAFTFAAALISGSAYNVAVLTQPAGQTCSVANGTGTIGSANVTNVAVSCAALPPSTYTVGGTLSGLVSGTVVLQNNGSGNLGRSSNGSFTFAAALAGGSAYRVTVLTQPAGQTCSVMNNSGTIGSANVTNVSVACSSTAAAIVTIVSPTTSRTYTTNSSPIEIAGTTSSSVNIASVTWANLSGGNGSATTTNGWADWSISGIILQSGINVVSVTATNTAGNSGTDTLTITYNPPDGSDDDLSGMNVWSGSWLRLTVTHSEPYPSVTTAYLNILSWDSNMRILRAKLYWQGNGRDWIASRLAFHYISGAPLSFLFSFDYAGVYGFSGSMSATVDATGSLLKARLQAHGVSEDDGERDDTEYVTIRGRLTSDPGLPNRRDD
jgi:hypothetical protein